MSLYFGSKTKLLEVSCAFRYNTQVKKYHFDPKQDLDNLKALVYKIVARAATIDKKEFQRLQKQHPRPEGGVYSKHQIVVSYRYLVKEKYFPRIEPRVLAAIQQKPTRTASGVVPVTVLTKPFPCPGKCIFCPNDIKMPKSYLSDEPGAQRAERNFFDPYLQTYNRLQALHNIGHQVDKVELIILGGTWSYYPEQYQIWFIWRCFLALNDFAEGIDQRQQIKQHYQQMVASLRQKQHFALSDDPNHNKQQLAGQEVKGAQLDRTYNQKVSQLYVAPERLAGFDTYQAANWQQLEFEQQRNVDNKIKNVGLVIETRPDNISIAEVERIRRLGCTKAQIGLQSLRDSVLKKNHRGHDVAASRRAMKLLRQAGFKIHAHWMANLYGSNPEMDIEEFDWLYQDPDFHPDELKVYPCSLIESAELMQYYQRGEWQPYTHQELLKVVAHTLATAPRYTRLTRVIRDIPSTDIVEGNKKTNFREIAQDFLEKNNVTLQEIRAREIRNKDFDPAQAQLMLTKYQTSVSIEYFLEMVLPDSTLLAFLRLSLPTLESPFAELKDSAIIREVHVYGPVTKVGQDGKTQHLGYGKRLIQHAEVIAKQNGFEKIAVISAIGTRSYYQKLGYQLQKLYQHKKL